MPENIFGEDFELSSFVFDLSTSPDRRPVFAAPNVEENEEERVARVRQQFEPPRMNAHEEGCTCSSFCTNYRSWTGSGIALLDRISAWMDEERYWLDFGYSGWNFYGPYMTCDGASSGICYNCNLSNHCGAVQDDEDYCEDDEFVRHDAASEETETLESITIYENGAKVEVKPISSLLLPPNGRTIRLMSFEQEVAYGAEPMAEKLGEAGFSPSSHVHSYGSSWDISHTRDTFVHVERDSSCGGEIIWSKLDLSDPVKAGRFEQGFNLVRDNIKLGAVRLDMHCGFHTHIDLKGYSMNAVANLYHAHNYLEDMFFRIGAANWSAHRTEVNDENYARHTPKGLKGNAEIGGNMRRDRFALNLTPYLDNGWENCHCGAFRYSAWEECTCSLGKSTVEFRWPNATANLVKVHAISSLLQGLVYACEVADAREFEELPETSFSSTNVAPDYEDVVNRIEWIGNHIPQTAQERHSLAYCFDSHFGPKAEEYKQMIKELPVMA